MDNHPILILGFLRPSSRAVPRGKIGRFGTSCTPRATRLPSAAQLFPSPLLSDHPVGRPAASARDSLRIPCNAFFIPSHSTVFHTAPSPLQTNHYANRNGIKRYIRKGRPAPRGESGWFCYFTTFPEEIRSINSSSLYQGRIKCDLFSLLGITSHRKMFFKYPHLKV